MPRLAPDMNSVLPLSDAMGDSCNGRPKVGRAR
jgi:hypothetical protein